MLRISESYKDPRARWARQPASRLPKKPKVSKGHNPHTQLDPPREADAEREENEASKGPKAHNEEGQQYLHPIRKGVSRGWD